MKTKIKWRTNTMTTTEQKARRFLAKLEEDSYDIYNFEIIYKVTNDTWSCFISVDDTLTGEYFSEVFRAETKAATLISAEKWFEDKGNAEKRELAAMATAVAKVSALGTKATSAAAKSFAASFVAQLSELTNLISGESK
jgi:hypothetical protein